MHFYAISERKYSLLFLKVSKSFQQLCEPVASLPQIFGQRIQSWGRQVHSSWKCSHLDLFLFLWTHHLLLLFPLSMFQLSQPSNNYHIAWLLTPTTTSCTSSSPTSASRTGTSPSPAAAASVQHLFNKFCKLEMIHGAQNATLFIWSNVCSDVSDPADWMTIFWIRGFGSGRQWSGFRKAWEAWLEKWDKGRRAHLGLLLVRKHAVQQPPSSGEGCHHVGKPLPRHS